MVTCAHLDHFHVTNLPASVPGCEDCLVIGDPWLHLRICLECGKVGCCDDSPNRHATRHAHGSGHPLTDHGAHGRDRRRSARSSSRIIEREEQRG